MSKKLNSGKEKNIKENGQNHSNLNEKECEQTKIKDIISEKNNKFF